MSSIVFGECSPSLVGARLNDPNSMKKLEPDQRGIARTLWRSHVSLGVMGAILGVMAGVLLIRLWPAAAAGPWWPTLRPSSQARD